MAPMRQLLATMNQKPGMADPSNRLCPFGEFENLHFARFVILDDLTTGDTELYGITPPALPLYLAFLGDFDGSYDDFIDELSARAGSGLAEIFSMCEDFDPDVELSTWMRAHEARPATYYCNWVGRTVRQCREEAQLAAALRSHLDASPDFAKASPNEVHRALRSFTQSEQAAGRLPLTPAAKTSFAWSLRHIWDWTLIVLLIVLGVVTLPLTLIPLLMAVFFLRRLEKTDPEFAPLPSADLAASLAAIEDYSVTNQFSAMGGIKPGFFRRTLLKVILWAINLTAKLIFTKGRLARVQTIHFARWVYLDGGKRLLFTSNYDGSLESYMDDFINKVAFGLNAVFSNGIGYPRTDWLVLNGAKREQLFKRFLRRHQLPTDVWYNAHDGFRAFDLEKNSLIRQGIERPTMPDSDLFTWVTML